MQRNLKTDDLFQPEIRKCIRFGAQTHEANPIMLSIALEETGRANLQMEI